MRRLRSLAPLILVAVLAAPACGGSGDKSDTNEATNNRRMNLPGAGARIMPASDTAVVEQARRDLEAACPGALVADTSPDPGRAVRTLIREQDLVGPNAIFESGNVDRAIPMSILLQREAIIAADCGLHGPAAELRRATVPG